MSDLNEQLQVNLQINEAIRARNELLNHSGNQLKSQIDLAWELCSAMECGENIDALKAKILSTREAIGSLSASAEKAAGKTKSMNKATEESASIFQKAGKFIKTALGYLTGWTLMKKGVEWMKNAFDSMIPTIKNLAKNTFNFFKTAISYIGRAKEGLIEMSYRLGQVTEYTRALERVRDKFGDLEKGTSKILKDSLRPMRSEFNQLTASGVTFSAVFGRGPGGMAKAIEFNAELMEKLNGGTERLRNEIGQNIAAMAIYRKGMGFTAEQQATLVALADSQGKNIVEVQHQYAKFSLEMSKRFGLDSKVIGRAMADMTANVGDFGTLSTRQLAQVATYTQKLGIETKALQGVIKKYDDFESAAKSAAMLNQTFGMQVDVLKLLKEEDPAARLNQLQRSFQATGRSYDQLSRAERRRLAELSGLDDKSAALAFSQNGLSMSYEQVQAAGEETEDKFKDLNETLKELSKNIAKNFYDPNKYKSFFEAFLGGFNRGIELSGPFMQVMRNIQRSLRIVEMAGYRLGKVFVDVFPGVKQLLEGLANYFDPATASSRMNQVIGVFTKFFQTLQKGPEHVRQAMIDLWNSLTKDFFKIFNLSGEGSKGMMLDGLKKILTTAINMVMSFAEIIVREVAKGIRMVIGMLAGDFKELGKSNKISDGFEKLLFVDWGALFGESWAGLKKSFSKDLLPALGNLGILIWEKLKQGFLWVAKKIDAWLTETFTWWPKVRDTIRDFYNKVEQWFLDMANSVKEFFMPFIEAYQEYGWETIIGGDSQGLKSKLQEKFGFVFDFFEKIKNIYHEFKQAWKEGGWFTKGIGDEADKGILPKLKEKLNEIKNIMVDWITEVLEMVWKKIQQKIAENPLETAGVGAAIGFQRDGVSGAAKAGIFALGASLIMKSRLKKEADEEELKNSQLQHQKMATEILKQKEAEDGIREERAAYAKMRERNITEAQIMTAMRSRQRELADLQQHHQKVVKELESNGKIAEALEARLFADKLRRLQEEQDKLIKEEENRQKGYMSRAAEWTKNLFGFGTPGEAPTQTPSPASVRPPPSPTPAPPMSMMLSDYHSGMDFSGMSNQSSNEFTAFAAELVAKSGGAKQMEEAVKKVDSLEAMNAMTKKIENLSGVETKLDVAMKSLPNENKMQSLKEKLSKVIISFNSTMSIIGDQMKELNQSQTNVTSMDDKSFGAIEQIANLKKVLVEIQKDNLGVTNVKNSMRYISSSITHVVDGLNGKDGSKDGIKNKIKSTELTSGEKQKMQGLSTTLTSLSLVADSLIGLQKKSVDSDQVSGFFTNVGKGVDSVRSGITNFNAKLEKDLPAANVQILTDALSPLNDIYNELTTLSNSIVKVAEIKAYTTSIHDSMDLVDGLFNRFGKVLPDGIAKTATSIVQQLGVIDSAFKTLPNKEVIATAIKIGEAFNGSTNGTLTFKHENININLAVKVEMSAEQIAEGLIKVEMVKTDGNAGDKIKIQTTKVDAN